MNRRQFLRWVGAGVGALSLSGCGQARNAASLSSKPNIIFIMADDLGWQELGCYGQKKIRTPNLDRMAAEGMRFTDYYSGSPVCAPSRCVLMTGRHGGHAFIRDNHEVGTWESFDGQLPLPQGTETIATMLSSQGYATGAFGKWGLGGVNSTGDPLNLGFDRFFGYNCQRHAHNLYPEFLIDNKDKRVLEGNTAGPTGQHYAPQVYGEEFFRFIRANRDRPFFAYWPTVTPHLALQAPQEEIDRYKGQWPETPYTGKSYQPQSTPRACYAAMISFMDRQIGELMSLLKELNIDENTVVFFTSDNGTSGTKEQVDSDFFESVGPLRGLKGTAYEGGIRVPMIVRWPGHIRPGTVTNLPWCHYDVMATLADLTGTTAPEDTDGISILPTLLSKPAEQKQHDYLFWDFAGSGGQLAVRMGQWKAVKQNLKKNPDAPLELYDLETDLGERKNVAGQFPDVVRTMEQMMLMSRTQPETERFRFGRYPQLILKEKE